MNISHDPKLNEISAKVRTGERLSFEDGVGLFNTDDLNALGKLADTVRRQLHSRTTYFNVNRHLNPTNVCYVDCKFCGFFRTPRQPEGHDPRVRDRRQRWDRRVRDQAPGPPDDARSRRVDS